MNVLSARLIFIINPVYDDTSNFNENTPFQLVDGVVNDENNVGVVEAFDVLLEVFEVLLVLLVFDVFVIVPILVLKKEFKS